MKTMMKTRPVLAATLIAILCWAAPSFGAPDPEDMAKAKVGDAAAQEKVGIVFYNEKNYTEAAAWYRKAGEQGRGNSCYILAQMYDYSLGITGDKNTATTWYRKALDADTLQAAQGDAEAMTRVALCYRYGKGVAKDDEKAQEWDKKAFVIFKQRAEGGDTNIYWRVGQAYSTGNGVEKNLEEAAKWYKRGAESGNALCMSRIGSMYIKGEGVPQDYAAAAEWLQKAVEKEYPQAYYHLGTLYENGNDVPKDTDKAVSLYKAGAEKNDYYAQRRLNELNIDWDDGVRLEEMQGKDAETIYAKAKSIMPVTANAIKLYRMAAEAGHAKAQFELGQALHLGLGNTAKDPQEAAKWFRAAADQGLAEAQYQMGYFHYYGKGMDKDPKEATRWFLKAAEQEYKDAFSQLGSAYEYGQGVPADINEAIKWYRKSADAGNTVAAKNAQELQAKLQVAQNVAGGEDFLRAEDLVRTDEEGAIRLYRKAAEAGHAQAQLKLAKAFYFGEGTDKNETEAARWYRKAAEQGIAEAQYEFGCCLRDGEGVQKDRKEAVKWFLKAAEQEYKDAFFRLGLAYQYGSGVPEDFDEAIKWYRKADAAGSTMASKSIQELQSRPQERAQTPRGKGSSGESDILADNDANALFRRAERMYKGEGMKKDVLGSVKLYTKAADQGHAEAQCFMGSWHNGDDPEACVKYYKMAAMQNHVEAITSLAFLYAEGCNGVEQDIPEAIRLYKKAVALGNTEAQSSIDGLRRYQQRQQHVQRVAPQMPQPQMRRQQSQSGSQNSQEREIIRVAKNLADAKASGDEEAIKKAQEESDQLTLTLQQQLFMTQQEGMRIQQQGFDAMMNTRSSSVGGSSSSGSRGGASVCRDCGGSGKCKSCLGVQHNNCSACGGRAWINGKRCGACDKGQAYLGKNLCALCQGSGNCKLCYGSGKSR